MVKDETKHRCSNLFMKRLHATWKTRKKWLFWQKKKIWYHLKNSWESVFWKRFSYSWTKSKRKCLHESVCKTEGTIWNYMSKELLFLPKTMAFQVIPNSCLYWAIDLILYKQVSLSRLYLVINLFLFYLLNRQVKPSHFWQMFPFYTHWKHQKTLGFLVFSGGIKWKHWPEMC